MIPYGSEILKAMLDGTWKTCGPFAQHVTVKMEIRDEEGDRFEHVLSIFMLGRSSEDYRHAFGCMFLVIDQYHSTRIQTVLAHTDCEAAIHAGLYAAAKEVGISVFTTYCSVHIIRCITKGLKKSLGMTKIPSCVRVTVSVINSCVSLTFFISCLFFLAICPV